MSDKRVARDEAADAGLSDREKKFVVHVEQRVEQRLERRLISIIRQESGDSYAGLPADHVLVNLNNNFPEVNYPERMMARLEREQEARVAHDERELGLRQYELETQRQDAAADRRQMNLAANRALLVVALFLAVGVFLTLAGYGAAGITLMGSTLASVVFAFLRQQGKK